MPLIDDILSVFLSGYSDSYREIRRQLYGRSYNFRREEKKGVIVPGSSIKRSIASTIWRLKRQGFLKEDLDKNLKITKRGRLYIDKLKKKSLFSHNSYIDTKNNRIFPIIFIFDIPEKQRRKRAWLRIELKLLNFKQLQKSVWIGKGPLPEKFINKLNDLDIFRYIHILEIKQRGTIPRYKKI